MASTTFFLHLLLAAAIISSTTTTAAQEKCNPEDKKALLEIKKAFNNSPIFTSWSPTTDCCTNSWPFIQCDPTTNRITTFSLLDFPQLSATLPSSLGDLPFLTTLVLHKLPNLTGPIPNSLSKLTNLQFLRLDWNSLTGLIPDFLHTLKHLSYINLSFNLLSGHIPASLALSPSLDFLRLDRNRLTGPIPPNFGSIKGGQIYRLDLSHNRLSGQIPASLGDMNFTFLQLARNNLTGDASFLFGKSKPLNQLDLSRNSLSFDLSKAGEEIPSRIGWLILDHNKIYGGLPDSMAELRYLNNLNVSYNRLCGKIPTGGNFADDFDQYSFLHNKCLCGFPLPACD